MKKESCIKSKSYLPFLIETTIMGFEEPFDRLRILQEINGYDIEEPEEEQIKMLDTVLDSYFNDGLILFNHNTKKFKLCKY